MSETSEIDIPNNFFDEDTHRKKFISIERLYDCATLLDLKETLEYRFEIDPNDDHFYDLNIRMHSEYEIPSESRYKTKVIQQKTIEELIDYINDWIDELHEKYGDHREEKEIIVDIFLKKRNPWYGKGKKHNIYKIINNKMYHIKFENTINKCLIRAVMESIGKSKNCRDIENYDTYYKGLDFQELKRKIELRHEVTIHITSSYKKLSKLMANKQNFEVILFSFNQHIGVVREELPDVKPIPGGSIQDYYINVPNREDIIIGTYDSEWEWEKLEDSTLKNKEPNLICLIYEIEKNNKISKVFDNFGKFIRYVHQVISTNKKDMYLYSHNGKRVEHQFLIQEKIKWYKRQNKVPDIKLQNIAGNSIKSFNWKFGKNSAHFLDTSLYMNMTLDSIAKSFKTSNTKGHKDLKEGMDKQLFYETKKWDWKNKYDVEYCMNDALILFEFIISFNEMIIDIYEFEKQYWVLSKASVSAIDKMFIFNLYPDIKNNSEQAFLFGESYLGGRNEIFYRGVVDVPEGYEIRSKDINSSYPYEMLKGVLGKYLGQLQNIPESPVPGRRWMILCSITYKEEYVIPPLGIKQESKLIFPNIMKEPNFRFLFDHEYYELKDNLNITNICGIYEFEEVKFNFIKHLFNIKSKIDKKDPMYSAIKVLINGCYGSLAMNLLRPFKEIKANNDLEVLFEEFTIDKIDEELSWMMAKDLIDTPVCYQAAASITSQARMHLWSKIRELQNEKDVKQILYCDTDSIYFVCKKDFVTAKGDEIGEWDEDVHQNMTILTCKGYICDNKITLKGMTRNDGRVLDTSKILSDGLIYTNDAEWIINSKTGEIYLKSSTKYTSLQYNKGIVLNNGKVIPINL